jgi:hypothetical protein
MSTQRSKALPLMRYQHACGPRVAEIDFHEADQLWSVTLIDPQRSRVHGLYPSLASAQLVLCALGFRRLEEAIA